MSEEIMPARGVHGVVSVPGDKSISHRYALLTSIAEGDSRISNYSTGADCQSTLACMRQLGVQHSFDSDNGSRTLIVNGRGLHSLAASSATLDAGNSGSTIRMLSGILAAQPFTSSIAGDESLSKRPMKRIMAPLAAMGARIEATQGQFPPLTIQGNPLRAIEYQTPVASAQVKSCVLLAGLYAEGETTVEESIVTRDHTEIALRELGADITLMPRRVQVRGGVPLKGRELFVPGDISSAAFFLVAALISPNSDLIVTGVGLNPTRTALLDVLRSMGAQIKLLHIEEANGEIVGNLQVKSSRLTGGVIEGATTAALIDEIPILSILGAVSEQGLTVRDAAELRVKETDRIETIASNLRAMGAEVITTADGLQIPGRQTLKAAEVHSYGDHRIAMAFSIAALCATGPSLIHDAAAASVSFLSSTRPSATSPKMDDAQESELTREDLVHDLNNVFDTITDAAELLAANRRWQPLAATLIRSVTRGKRLLGAIPDSSPTLSGIISAASQYVTDYCIAARKPKMRFVSQVVGELKLPGSTQDWERVFVNLFLNAAQIMKKPGRIDIGATQADGRLQITVSDSGPGIPVDILPRMFRSNVSTKETQNTRTGLGLHIVAAIVGKYDGSIVAANRERGSGAVFTISLPSA